LLDFFALTMGDLLPVRYSSRNQRTAPELLYFIHRVTLEARISCHIAVVALIYVERCQQALPKKAVGNQVDTAHRIFIASLLTASKFLHGTQWATYQQTGNANLLCADEDKPCCGIYTCQQVNQLERSFLKLIRYRCWVDSGEVQAYLTRHRQDLLL
ncbi:hypothetical protein BDF14DRAFT_1730663, partial [Spinellus fusiger]